jgi:hypothetical protein
MNVMCFKGNIRVILSYNIAEEGSINITLYYNNDIGTSSLFNEYDGGIDSVFLRLRESNPPLCKFKMKFRYS